MWKSLSLPSLLGAFVLTACAAAAPQARSETVAGGIAPEMPMATAAAPAPEAGFDLAAVGQPAQERLVLKTASLSLVVADADRSLAEISRMAEEMDGWVVSSNAYKTAAASGVEVTRASLTIRVPAQRLNEALDRIKAGAVSVESESVSGQDVTSEYTDLQSRLKNLEAAEAQLQNIMDSAVKTQDVLDVYNQLVSVREQIEVIKGQMKYYEESAAFSSINVELIPDALSQPIQIGGWSPKGTAKEALEALIQALQFMADALIWGLICVLPVGLVFGLPGYFVGRAALRRMRKAKAA